MSELDAPPTSPGPPHKDSLPKNESPFRSESGKDAIETLTDAATEIATRRLETFFAQKLNDAQFANTANEAHMKVPDSGTTRNRNVVAAATKDVPTLLDGDPSESQWVKTRNEISSDHNPSSNDTQKSPAEKSTHEWNLYDVAAAVRILKSSTTNPAERYRAAQELNMYLANTPDIIEDVIRLTGQTSNRIKGQIEQEYDTLISKTSPQDQENPGYQLTLTKNLLLDLRLALENNWRLPTISRLELLKTLATEKVWECGSAFSQLEVQYFQSLKSP